MSFLLDTNVVSEWTKTRPNAGVDEYLRNDLALRFERRIIGVDGAIADKWGRMIARREARAPPIGAMDALVAATAQAHALTVVTRNATDFRASVKAALNPWT